jgi:hypothetical protein
MSTSKTSNLLALSAAIMLVAHAFPVYADVKFPAVDQATQKARDDTRKQILQNELTTETKAADDAAKAVLAAKQSKQPAPVITDLKQSADSHGKNVEALKKELASISASPSASAPASASPYKVPARVIRASLDTNRPTPYWDVYHRTQPNPNGDADDGSRQTTPPSTTAVK